MKIFPTKGRPNFLVITKKARKLSCNREKAIKLSCNREKAMKLSCNCQKTRNCARNEKEKPESSLPFGLTLSFRVISTTKVTGEQEVDYFNPETDRGIEVDQLQPRTDCVEQKLTAFQSPVQYC
jgi:hypothetical protein